MTQEISLENAKLYRVDASGDGFLFKLQPAADCTGNSVLIKKIDNSLNSIVVAAAGDELIDGFDICTISRQYQCVTFVSNGVGWDIV